MDWQLLHLLQLHLPHFVKNLRVLHNLISSRKWIYVPFGKTKLSMIPYGSLFFGSTFLLLTSATVLNLSFLIIMTSPSFFTPGN